MRGRRREPERRVHQHPVRVDVVRRPAGRCLHADAGPNTAAYAFPNSRARRSHEGSHTQSHAGAVATSNAATNYPGALACADACADALADAAADARTQPGANARADARVVPRRHVRRRRLRSLFPMRRRDLRERASRDELRALPRRHV